jgi:hypothetical protein
MKYKHTNLLSPVVRFLPHTWGKREAGIADLKLLRIPDPHFMPTFPEESHHLTEFKTN